MSAMRRALFAIAAVIAMCAQAAAQTIRPPAVPLITHTPYFSVWSTTDRLTDGWSKHWTGAIQAFVGLVRIDGQPYRFMGTQPDGVPAMEQRSVTVHPTRTVYEFEAAGISLQVEFLSPLLPDDLMVLTRPATYITLTAHSTDSHSHKVETYFDATGEIAVNSPDQSVIGARNKLSNLDLVSFRIANPSVLGRSGDDLRIEWGTFYLAAPKGTADSTIHESGSGRREWTRTGTLNGDDDIQFPRPANREWPSIGFSFDFGTVGSVPVAHHLIAAFDEQYAVEYFNRKLPPLWRADGTTPSQMLKTAESEYTSLRNRCAAFDAKLEADLTKRGGENYARLATLAYRQCFAAHCIVRDLNGTLLMFSKENFSNGCIGTVDVTYPGSPFFLYFNPALLRAQIEPIMEYAASVRWKWPFAPHDLGQYPLANGQVYGGGERTAENQMPVEECGNMLIMAAALNDKSLTTKYWPTLSKWAHYLLDKGLDPENQLCTDDFAGHLAHNANLSIKAIVALGGYAKLCATMGDAVQASEFHAKAKAMATKWVSMAREDDHFKLAFDQSNTWSQKYNLVWDRLLDLGLFDPSVAKVETAFYLKKLNEFGLPLDSRKDYTKLDWCVWTACLTKDRSAFDPQIKPLYDWLSKTASRVPLTDWYDTKTNHMIGFQARSVVGGLFIPMLDK